MPLCVAEKMLTFSAGATAWRSPEFPIWKNKDEIAWKSSTNSCVTRTVLLVRQRPDLVFHDPDTSQGLPVGAKFVYVHFQAQAIPADDMLPDPITAYQTACRV